MPLPPCLRLAAAFWSFPLSEYAFMLSLVSALILPLPVPVLAVVTESALVPGLALLAPAAWSCWFVTLHGFLYLNDQ